MGLKERLYRIAREVNIDTDEGCGYHDGLMRAADYAQEADALMEEMAEAVRGLLSWCEEIAGDTQFGEDAEHEEITTGEANKCLRKYNQYKEQTNEQ
ncbi:hypothetical protein SLPG_00061 [Salicola phage CGphi29]|uniref:hypothetical protein n=1 Tax=Salicola phage CGphi29 TaxID=754067 RepID=UPI0002C107D7|nr:hypothetical protein SLPG_00061 [Salicola phage CGphi29]AGH31855.1 hypothetical protein SLPG_00061 [Salicola phage CGphi29]